MEQWIREQFEITQDGWTNQDGSTEDTFQFKCGGYVRNGKLSWFCNNFADAGTPPTLESLKSCDPNDTFGWHVYFDCWEQQGLLN